MERRRQVILFAANSKSWASLPLTPVEVHPRLPVTLRRSRISRIGA
jgi:hypothetical protein